MSNKRWIGPIPIPHKIKDDEKYISISVKVADLFEKNKLTSARAGG